MYSNKPKVFDRFKSFFLHKYELTKVFGFVGTSGSGKSYNTPLLIKKHHIDLVIDDGILIKNGSVLAGKSSKEEKSEMLAVRRAIFQDPSHANEVRLALAREYYPRILILGTSIKMVEKICENLFLPLPSKIIHIEDVASKEDIDYSHKVRNEESKHIIPLSYFEIRRYLNSKNSDKISINDNILENKTQVSPQFGKKTDDYSETQIRFMISEILYTIDEGLVVYYININDIDEKKYIDIGIRNSLEFKKPVDKLMLKWEIGDALSKISKTLVVDKII